MDVEQFEKVKRCARIRVEARGDEPSFENLLAEVGVITMPADEAALDAALLAFEEEVDEQHEAVLKEELAKLKKRRKERRKKP